MRSMFGTVVAILGPPWEYPDQVRVFFRYRHWHADPRDHGISIDSGSWGVRPGRLLRDDAAGVP